MIVRRRDARLVVDMCKDLEAERRILVQAPSDRVTRRRRNILDEILVGQQSLEIDADLFAAGRARVARKDIAAVGDKLIEIVGHGVLPGLRGRTSVSRNMRPGASGCPQDAAMFSIGCNLGGQTWVAAKPTTSAIFSRS